MQRFRPRVNKPCLLSTKHPRISRGEFSLALTSLSGRIRSSGAVWGDRLGGPSNSALVCQVLPGPLSPLTVFSSIWATGEAMVAILILNARHVLGI